MNSPAVTIVLPVKNCADYLQTTIDSVLAQTYTNYELFIVLDYADTSTATVAYRNEYRDSRISILQNMGPAGLANALNYGISHSKAKYIARIDGDDICAPNRIKIQLDLINRSPEIGLVFSGFNTIDKHGSFLRKYNVGWIRSNFLFFLLASFPPHSTALFNRELFYKIGTYNKNYHRAQDRDLWFKFSKVCNICVAREQLVSIRRHTMGISQSTSGSLLQRHFFILSTLSFLYPKLTHDELESLIKTNSQIFDMFPKIIKNNKLFTCLQLLILSTLIFIKGF